VESRDVTGEFEDGGMTWVVEDTLEGTFLDEVKRATNWEAKEGCGDTFLWDNGADGAPCEGELSVEAVIGNGFLSSDEVESCCDELVMSTSSNDDGESLARGPFFRERRKKEILPRLDLGESNSDRLETVWGRSTEECVEGCGVGCGVLPRKKSEMSEVFVRRRRTGERLDMKDNTSSSGEE
jgi:hypothetical protein